MDTEIIGRLLENEYNREFGLLALKQGVLDGDIRRSEALELIKKTQNSISVWKEFHFVFNTIGGTPVYFCRIMKGTKVVKEERKTFENGSAGCFNWFREWILEQILM